MKNNIELIHTLSERYFDGTSTLDDERLLSRLLLEEPTLPKELEPLRLMMGGLSQIKEANSAQTRGLRITLKTVVSACASIAAAVVVGLAFFSHQSEQLHNDEVLCYINGEPITDINVVMEQTKYLKNLEDLGQTINAIDLLIN